MNSSKRSVSSGFSSLRRARGEIPVELGETLSWRYLQYARTHPLVVWDTPTAILYPEHDALTSRETVEAFVRRFRCRLTVLENVELPLIYQGVNADDRRDMALEALARVGLANRIKHRPVEMSGGQQQRVAIARAIATKPPIIMADEPTGALDSHTGQEVLKFLQELNKEGSTVILITHDNGIAATARRVVRLADGRIIEDREQEVDWL